MSASLEKRIKVLETPLHLRQDLLEHFQGKQPQTPALSLKKQRENNHD